MDYFQILCAIGVLLFSLYYYYSSHLNFWKDRGIPGPKPTVFVGNFLKLLRQTESISDQSRTWYMQYKNEPVFGIYQGTKPIVVINDLDLIKDVLIRDFSLFVDRGFHVNPKVEPLSQHLFLLEAERWRPLRTRLSPIFTSGKLREMFPLVAETAAHLEKFLNKVTGDGKPVECRDLAAKFTTDVIGSCVFGISMNALEDEDSEFRRRGRQIFTPSFKQNTQNILRQLSPFLFKIFGPFLHNYELDNFFINVVKDTMKHRKDNNIKRPDFINMLMELKEHPEKLDNIEFTDTLLTAQAFVFFVAGFETSSTTISHALYQLALNQDIQDKLRNEIREAYTESNGTWTYDQIKGMKYLDKVFKETLRMYPILSTLSRQVSENYTFKGTKITIPKGTTIWVPVYGIQRDPAIYSNPSVFDPERFNDEAVAARHPMSYLPFGDGPRNCIGSRFAINQTKVGLAGILRNYKVDVCKETVVPYVSDPKSFLLCLKGGVQLKISKV